MGGVGTGKATTRTRTADLSFTKASLYQLSYGGTVAGKPRGGRPSRVPRGRGDYFLSSSWTASPGPTFKAPKARPIASAVSPEVFAIISRRVVT